MTGADLKKWIDDNNAQDLEIWATDDGCGLYPVNKATIETDEAWRKEYTYIRLDE